MALIIPGTPQAQHGFKPVRILPKKSFKVAIEGETISFIKGTLHPKGFNAADLEEYIKRGDIETVSLEKGAKVEAETAAKKRLEEQAEAAQAQKEAIDAAVKQAQAAGKRAQEAAEALKKASAGDAEAARKAAEEAQAQADEAAEAAKKAQADAANGTSDSEEGTQGEDGDAPTLESLMKLTKEGLIEKAGELNLAVDETKNKETIAKAILASLAA